MDGAGYGVARHATKVRQPEGRASVEEILAVFFSCVVCVNVLFFLP